MTHACTLLESMRCGLYCCLADAAGEGAGIGAPKDMWEVARLKWQVFNTGSTFCVLFCSDVMLFEHRDTVESNHVY